MGQMSARVLALAGLLAFLAPAFKAQSAKNMDMQPFGKTSDGQEVFLYTLRNQAGMEVKITNYGGTITSIKVKDRHGKFGDVVLGFDNLDGYVSKTNKSYLDVLVAPSVTLIAQGTLVLNARHYHIANNVCYTTQLAGLCSFVKVVWAANVAPTTRAPRFDLHSSPRLG